LGFYFLHAQHRGSRSTKTEKTKKKQAEAENNELKKSEYRAAPRRFRVPSPQGALAPPCMPTGKEEKNRDPQPKPFFFHVFALGLTLTFLFVFSPTSFCRLRLPFASCFLAFG
jgi:hypothetical protein